MYCTHPYPVHAYNVVPPARHHKQIHTGSISLNLSQNPLTESLSKLRHGRGRGVVRQLIPQIRVLDGIHLSSGEAGAVDAQTLDEAVNLTCRDASRARAAWSEEDVTEATAAAAAVGAASTATTIKVVQEDRWRPDGVGKDECLPLAGLDSCFSRSPTKKGVATVAGLGGGGSPIPPQLVPDQGGGMHWDSDLTQGGRQALSGNPRCAWLRCVCFLYCVAKRLEQSRFCSFSDAFDQWYSFPSYAGWRKGASCTARVIIQCYLNGNTIRLRPSNRGYYCKWKTSSILDTCVLSGALQSENRAKAALNNWRKKNELS